MIMGDYSYFEGSMNDKSFMRLQDGRWRMIYPAPFFDPIAMQSIMDPKILIQWSRFFYEWHPIVHAAINGMVTYPITDFIFDTDNEELRQNYEEAFKTLNVRSLLIRAGLDYYISGNAFMSPLMPFKRMMKCPDCGFLAAADKASFRPSLSTIQMVCPSCGSIGEPEVQDINTHDLKEFKMTLWNPLNMFIDYDEIMDTTDYWYSIPSLVKAGICKGEKRYFNKYPLYFIQAVHKKQMIRIFNDKMLHMKRETHSSTYIKGLGQPLITPVMKFLFHLLVLLRAQDALAIDQILPWTVISPAANSNTDPGVDMDLDGWQQTVKTEYNEWKKDPLRKSIMPIPMNAQIVGAQGKTLMVTPEIDSITNQILAGMGVPQEFVFGGLQWSGANVSLRMLENKFINYRTMMQCIIDYIVDQISTYFGYARIDVRMQSFKMADDIAQKQTIIGLADANIISRQTMLNEVMPEADFGKEQKRIKKEQIDQIKLQQEVQRASTVAGVDMGPAVGGADGPQPKGLPEKNPPRSEGANKQI